MAYLEDGYISDLPASRAMPAERATFIQRTYGHLAGAILAFVGLEALLLTTPLGESVTLGLFSLGRLGIFVYMLVFMGVGTLAQTMSFARSRGTQYAGLGLYVVLQAILCLPLLYIASNSRSFAGQHVIEKAGLLTLGIFAGLSMTVFMTRKDFSFIGPFLFMAGWILTAVLLAGVLFGFDMGLFMTFALLALAAAYIVYDTSNVMNHYDTTQYVGASLALFASIALLFRVILRLMMERQR